MSNNVTLHSDITVSNFVNESITPEKFTIFKVHSVFEHGFNIVSNKDKNDLIFVGEDVQPVATHGVTIDSRAFQFIINKLKAGERVKISSDEWAIYEPSQFIQLKLERKEIKDLHLPKLSKEKLYSSRFIELCNEANVYTFSGFNLGGKITDIYNAWLEKENPFDDVDPFVEKLIGAGVGLTPSGDDFLQGMIAVEGALTSQKTISTSVSRALKYKGTTDIAKAYYRGVLAKQGNEDWNKLFHEIEKSDNQKKISQIIHQLQKYGHTSGSDILLGMQTFCILYQNNEYKEY